MLGTVMVLDHGVGGQGPLRRLSLAFLFIEAIAIEEHAYLATGRSPNIQPTWHRPWHGY